MDLTMATPVDSECSSLPPNQNSFSKNSKSGSAPRLADNSKVIKRRAKDHNRPTSMRSSTGDSSLAFTQEESTPDSLYEILEKRSKEIELPGEMWFCHVKPGLYIMFGKVKPDTQLSSKMIIYPDMKTKVFHNEKWLPWLQANINSEDTLVEILKQLHSLNLAEFL